MSSNLVLQRLCSKIALQSLLYLRPHHHSTNSSWLPQTSRKRLVNIDEPHIWDDYPAGAAAGSCILLVSFFFLSSFFTLPEYPAGSCILLVSSFFTLPENPAGSCILLVSSFFTLPENPAGSCILLVSSLFCRCRHHHSTNSSWLPQTSRKRLVNIDEPHIWDDYPAGAAAGSCILLVSFFFHSSFFTLPEYPAGSCILLVSSFFTLPENPAGSCILLVSSLFTLPENPAGSCILLVSSLFCRCRHHHSTNSSWLPQTSRKRLVNIDEPHIWDDYPAGAAAGSCILPVSFFFLSSFFTLPEYPAGSCILLVSSFFTLPEYPAGSCILLVSSFFTMPENPAGSCILLVSSLFCRRSRRILYLTCLFLSLFYLYTSVLRTDVSCFPTVLYTSVLRTDVSCFPTVLSSSVNTSKVNNSEIVIPILMKLDHNDYLPSAQMFNDLWPWSRSQKGHRGQKGNFRQKLFNSLRLKMVCSWNLCIWLTLMSFTNVW